MLHQRRATDSGTEWEQHYRNRAPGALDFGVTDVVRTRMSIVDPALLVEVELDARRVGARES